MLPENVQEDKILVSSAAENEKYPKFNLPLVIKMYTQLNQIVSNSKSVIFMSVFFQEHKFGKYAL